MEFSRQEYWSGLPFPSPRDLPHPEMEPSSPISPALAGRSFTTSASRECTDLIKAYMWKSGRQEPPRESGTAEWLRCSETEHSGAESSTQH